MSKIAKNIAHLRKLRNRTQEQFADDLGITKSRLGAYEESRSAPPIEILIRLSDHFRLPIDVMVRRDLTLSNEESFIQLGQQRILFPITLDVDGNDLIEVVGMKASAGYLNGYGDPEYVDELPKMKLPFMPTGKFRAFPIKGDSMPPLTEGAFVVGKYVEEITHITNGKTYILVTKNDGIVYKRTYFSPTEKNTLELHSDNKTYLPYPIHFSDILEAWEFTCSINTREYEENELNTSSIMGMMRELRVELETIKNR